MGGDQQVAEDFNDPGGPERTAAGTTEWRRRWCPSAVVDRPQLSNLRTGDRPE
jgi:hypothetical protein